ncbi:MAG: sugar phosphate isomerase/epimerase [Bacteroidales bacterium]
MIRYQAFAVLAFFLAVQIQAGEPLAAKKQLGIATYSVKGLESDIEGTFKSLQASGYTVMEISNYNANQRTVEGMSPKDYAALAEKYGMDIISSHTRAQFDVNDVAGTLEAWGKIFDDHKILGAKYVVFPMNQWANTPEAVKVECDLMNKIGAEANKRGLKFGYHNHNMEFAKIGDSDEILEDFLINNTDADKVFFQMDVYWVTQGNADPVAYLKKYPKRFQVLHIKDDYVIGESGKIDYEAIFTTFYKNGYKDWFVEIEEYMTPEQREAMRKMIEEMRKAQAEGRQPEGGARRMGPPQRTPEEQAQRLATSLDAIAKSAEFLSAAKYVK